MVLKSFSNYKLPSILIVGMLISLMLMMSNKGISSKEQSTLYLSHQPSSIQTQKDYKNVLFITMEGLRPEIGAFYTEGKGLFPGIKTPNFDALAARSLVLKKAYSQYNMCGPSRYSMLTGRRPDTTHVYSNYQDFLAIGSNFTSLPQYFKQHNYIVKVIGNSCFFGYKSLIHWTEPFDVEGIYNSHWQSKNRTWVSVSKEEQLKHSDLPLPDDEITNLTIDALKSFRGASKPFFISPGFIRPHLPFTCPEKYFDLYPLDKIPLPSNPFVARYLPEITWSKPNELKLYEDIKALKDFTGKPNNTLPLDLVKQLRRAYYACVTYIDHQIGRIVKEVEELGLAENTAIAVWSDHGMVLGEHGYLGKHDHSELSNWIPMFIHIPGVTDHGIISQELVEAVDLYPTVIEAAGLPKVKLCPEGDLSKVLTCTEGTSMIPLIDKDTSTWKKAAFYQKGKTDCENCDHLMGYSMITHKYRITEWFKFDIIKNKPKRWEGSIATELYDHQSDPMENTNVASWPKYQDVLRRLQRQLKQGWRKALPEAKH